MVDSSNIYREQQKAVALEFMEKALAILVMTADIERLAVGVALGEGVIVPGSCLSFA